MKKLFLAFFMLSSIAISNAQTVIDSPINEIEDDAMRCHRMVFRLFGWNFLDLYMGQCGTLNRWDWGGQDNVVALEQVEIEETNFF